MGKVKIIGHSLFCMCFYAHGKVLQAVPGRGSHPGLFSMGLAIMVCCGSVGTGENIGDVFDIKLITVDKGF